MIFDVCVKQKLQRQNTTIDSEIKINQNGCNFFRMHEEFNSVWVDSLAAGNTFLSARAVHMRYSQSQTLIKY